MFYGRCFHNSKRCWIRPCKKSSEYRGGSSTKKSILAIPPDDDNLCCAKAILFALANLNKDTRLINTLRNRKTPALLNRAQNLHQLVGLSSKVYSFFTEKTGKKKLPRI